MIGLIRLLSTAGGPAALTVRDLPSGGSPVVLKWRKRIFECRHALYKKRTGQRRAKRSRHEAVLTERARQWAFQQVGFRDRAVSAVAGELGVARHTVMTQVSGRGKPLVDDSDRLSGVRASGVDETSFLRAAGNHPRHCASGIADLSAGRTARPLSTASLMSPVVAS